MRAASREQKTILAFQSTAFNTTTTRDYFINADCFGDDVARWLISELRTHGLQTDEQPGQEDFGWYVRFGVQGAKHFALIGFRSDSHNGEGEWICRIERAALMKGVPAPEAVEAVRRILCASPMILGVRLCSATEL